MVKVAIHQPDEQEFAAVAAEAAAVAKVSNQSSSSVSESPVSGSAAARGRPLLKLVFLAALLIAAAPSLISLTGTAGLFLSLIAPRAGSAVQFEALQLHWWSPVSVSRLQLRDLSELGGVQVEGVRGGTAATDLGRIQQPGPPLLEVRRAATRQPLWQLVLNGGRGVELEVVEPRLRLVSVDGSSNLESTLAELCGDTSSDSSAPFFPLAARVRGGVVECYLASGVSAGGDVSGASLRHLANLEQLEAQVSTLDTTAAFPLVEAAAVMRESEGRQSRFYPAGRSERLAADLDDVLKDFPALPLNELSGSSDAAGAGTGLVRLILKPRVDESERQLIQAGARDLDLSLLRPLLQLAGFAGDLEGRISGGIDARIAGPALADGIAGRVLLEGTGVRVRQSNWAQDEWLPLGNLRAAGAAALAGDGLLLDELRIQSDVLELSGSGEVRRNAATASESASATASASAAASPGDTGGQAEIRADLQLDRLARALRGTLGLAEGVDVESGVLHLEVRAESDRQLVSGGDLRGLSAKWHVSAMTQDLRVRRDSLQLENSAGVQLEAIGTVAGGMPALRQARFTAGFGVLDCVPDGAAWRLAGKFEPEAFWQQLRQLVDVPQPGLTAPLSFQCRAAVESNGLQLTDLTLTSTDLKVSSLAMGLYPSEMFPRNVDGQMEFHGTAAAVKTLIAPWHDAWWLADTAVLDGRLEGRRTAGFEASMRIRPEPRAALGADRVRSISRTQTKPAVWSGNLLSERALLIDEADLQMSLEAGRDGRQYTVQSGELTLPGLHAQLSGGLRLEDGWVNLAMSAATRYDLAILSERMFDPQAGLKFSGSGREVFTLSGDPAAIGVAPAVTAAAGRASAEPRFTGSGVVTWDAAEFQGLSAGPGSMSIELLDDLVRSGPVQCTLNGGSANLLWQYDITQGLLALAAGSRVENLQLTEEFCRSWLGYVSPVLAGAVEVQGRLSARTEDCVWDFETTENCVVRGEVTVHEAAAVPGGSLTRLLEMVDLVRSRGGDSAPWSGRSLTLPNQTIPVRLERGWVSHENLAFELAGYRLTTSGAVGLNQQLQLTLNVPLEKASAGGRAVPVALRGTILAPQPDAAGFLQAVGSQQLQKQLQNQVDRAVNDQLKKLLGRE